MADCTIFAGNRYDIQVTSVDDPIQCSSSVTLNSAEYLQIINQIQDNQNEYDPYQNFLDGHQLGWGVATVMLIAFAIRSIYRR